MSPHLPLPALLCCVIALLASSLVTFPSAAAAVSSLSTFAIASTSSGTHIICALVSPKAAASGDQYALNCTTLNPGGPQETYSSGAAYSTGITAGDGFLCGVGTYGIQNPSPTYVMLWWEFQRLNSTEDQKPKRLYRGAPIMGLGAGGSHVCGLIEERIACWRWRGFSQPPGARFSAIAVGRDFVCGILKGSGQVWCHGNDTSVVGSKPRGSGYVIIAASSCRACVVSKSSRGILCWGAGASGSEEELSSEVAALALGERNRTCTIDGNGMASCWGEPGFSLPVGLKAETFLSITASGEVFCGVLKANYSLACWGNSQGLANGMHRVVFDRVLPGQCQPNSRCRCGPLAGSGITCPAGTVVCGSCDIDPDEVPPPPVPLGPPVGTPTNHTGDNGGSGGGSDKKRIFLVVGSVGAGLALVTLVLIFTLYRRRRSRSQVHDSGRLDADPQLENGRPRPSAAPPAAVKQYAFEVLHAITDGFSDRNKIGYGSFGSVYRAVLPDGREVAIKRAEPPRSSSPPTPPTPRAVATAANSKENKEQAFESEVELLSRVNHRNLVRLLGFCREGPELVLVYEYMVNGTLRDQLHRIRDSPLVRSWSSRFRIALDAARGVEYLHRYAVPPTIHRDIKPSNILLDDAGTAKVADFGLCCTAPECNECGCEEEYSGGKRADNESHSASSAVQTAGTVGYMDPEYYRLQFLTAKSDVYSFGVVLLELLTGRRAICRPGEDERDTDPCNVVDFAVPHIESGEVQLVLDPNLPPPRPCEIEAVQQVGDLAAYCVQREGRNRPDMAYVVGELQLAVDACSPPLLLSRSLTRHSW